MDPFIASLDSFAQREGRPVRVALWTTGGTFLCRTDRASGRYTPITDEATIEDLLLDGVGLKDFQNMGLLEPKIFFVEALDSSQMKQPERDLIVSNIAPEYPWMDGGIVVHGTDTGERTATDLPHAFPYFDPVELSEGKRSYNATKPIMVLSSQVPITYERPTESQGSRYKLSLVSDGPRNLAVGIMGIADGKLGEAGLITNDLQLLRGTVSHKGDEMGIPPYEQDKAVAPIATLTSAGLRYTAEGFLRPQKNGGTPYVLNDRAKYETDTMLIESPASLALLMNAVKREEQDLPKVLFYQTVGQGHVHHDDVPRLHELQEHGMQVFRVPIPGGRIPPGGTSYDVPGDEFPALNMQPETASAKALSVLDLANRLGQNEPAFVKQMMEVQWGNEFLPNR